MTKNPLTNALTAALYIVGIVSLMYFGSTFVESEDTVLIPMAMLSLFTLSAAVMATVFFYQPISLLLEGEKESAFKLALHTIGYFAVITALFFLTFLTLSFF
ncbi:MAG: hypothetical protein V4674_02920 [Patescibacteria group bacterium]